MKLNKVLVSLETNGIEIFEFWNADKIENLKKNFDNNAVDINILPIVELYSILPLVSRSARNDSVTPESPIFILQPSKLKQNKQILITKLINIEPKNLIKYLTFRAINWLQTTNFFYNYHVQILQN